MNSPFFTIDLAHPPRQPAAVEAELLEAWKEVRNSGTYRVLKVIHGYGSSGTGGTTRTTVRNWAYAHRKRFRGVIQGEQFNLLDPGTQALRREIGDFGDPDLFNENSGITVIWIR
jgi:hypothetical protein